MSVHSWEGKHGAKRIQAEFLYLTKLIAQGNMPQVHNLRLLDDNLFQWRFELKNFDEDMPGGKALNQDLKDLKEKHGQDHVLMEILFKEDYPTDPFFLRVVSPRCQWYTGHVTAGGSVCIESLTQAGTPGAWQPSFSVESILNVVLTNMIDCEVVQIQTLTGPGGLTGPLRIDLGSRYVYNVMHQYSLYEAESAFSRTLRNHQKNGW